MAGFDLPSLTFVAVIIIKVSHFWSHFLKLLQK
jgi:hypothetical protein